MAGPVEQGLALYAEGGHEGGWRDLRLFLRGARQPAPLHRRAVHNPHRQRSLDTRGHGDGPRDDNRGAAPRRARRHELHRRTAERALRRGRRDARRRSHQARKITVQVGRGISGGEPSQDVRRNGEGHPRRPHQARRPSPQYAHDIVAPPREAAFDSARDARNIRAARAPSRNISGQARARRPFLQNTRPGDVLRHQAPRAQKAARARDDNKRGDGHPLEQATGGGHRGLDKGTPEAFLQHLRKDAPQEPFAGAALRPSRAARHSQDRRRVLSGARPRPHDMEAYTRPLRRLYSEPEEQHVPVAAYHRRRPERGSARGADKDEGDALPRRVRNRRPLELQRGRAEGRQPRQGPHVDTQGARDLGGGARQRRSAGRRAVHGQPQDGRAFERRFRLHAQGQGRLGAERLDLDRFRLRDTHGDWTQMRRHDDKRAYRADGPGASERRHSTHTDIAAGQALARLAQDCEIQQNARENQVVVPPAGASGARGKITTRARAS